MQHHSLGFTLIELVVVLILIGILAAYAAPKFSGRGGYSELAAQQDVKQSIRYAQQLAMSRTDRTFSFVISGSQIDVRNNGTSVGNPYPKTVLNDVTLDAANLSFDRFGATADANIRIIGPAQTLRVCVIGITGYARDC